MSVKMIETSGGRRANGSRMSHPPMLTPRTMSEPKLKSTLRLEIGFLGKKMSAKAQCHMPESSRTHAKATPAVRRADNAQFNNIAAVFERNGVSFKRVEVWKRFGDECKMFVRVGGRGVDGRRVGWLSSSEECSCNT